MGDFLQTTLGFDLKTNVNSTITGLEQQIDQIYKESNAKKEQEKAQEKAQDPILAQERQQQAGQVLSDVEQGYLQNVIPLPNQQEEQARALKEKLDTQRQFFYKEQGRTTGSFLLKPANIAYLDTQLPDLSEQQRNLVKRKLVGVTKLFENLSQYALPTVSQGVASLRSEGGNFVPNIYANIGNQVYKVFL